MRLHCLNMPRIVYCCVTSTLLPPSTLLILRMQKRLKLDVICISICSNQNDGSAFESYVCVCVYSAQRVYSVAVSYTPIDTITLNAHLVSESLIFDCIRLPTECGMYRLHPVSQ